MLLAAGRGERMRPLSDQTPKPLLQVSGKPLMQWHLEALARGGVKRVVVNTSWLGAQIEQSFGTNFLLDFQAGEKSQSLLRRAQRRGNPAATGEQSTQQSLQIAYSHEGRDFGGALETAGGISRALPLLCQTTQQGCPNTHPDTRGKGFKPKPEQGDAIFWLLAGDVFVPGFLFTQALVESFAASGLLAHLWLVPNPTHHPQGDFGLDLNARVMSGISSSIGLALNLPSDDARPRYTYSTIGLYRKALFVPPWCSIPAGNPLGVKAPLAALLRAAMDNGLVSAELYRGAWTDVGTPERLQQLNGDKH